MQASFIALLTTGSTQTISVWNYCNLFYGLMTVLQCFHWLTLQFSYTVSVLYNYSTMIWTEGKNQFRVEEIRVEELLQMEDLNGWRCECVTFRVNASDLHLQVCYQGLANNAPISVWTWRGLCTVCEYVCVTHSPHQCLVCLGNTGIIMLGQTDTVGQRLGILTCVCMRASHWKWVREKRADRFCPLPLKDAMIDHVYIFFNSRLICIFCFQ